MEVPVIVNWDNKLFRYVVEMSDYTISDPPHNWGCFARMDPDFAENIQLVQLTSLWDDNETWQDLENIDNIFDNTLDLPYPERNDDPRKAYIYKTFSSDETDPIRPWMPGEDYPIKYRNLTLKFPLYSVETYIPSDYVLKVSTWISDTEVVLGSYLIDDTRRAAQSPEMMLGERYVENISFKIPDPWDIVYGESWQEWRQKLCGEKQIEETEHYPNNTVTSLMISIYPIVSSNNIYYGISTSTPGSTSITISRNTGFMNPVLRFKEHSSDLEIELEYNEIYHNIQEYFLETYYVDIQELVLKYILTIQDENDIYNMIEYVETPEESEDDHIRYVATCPKNQLNILDWQNYWSGLFMRGMIEIWDGDQLILSITTNDISLTPDVYKYLIYSDIDGIELNLVRMYQYNIHAANKINKTVVKVDNINDSKTKIVKPVFFQAGKLDGCVIYPETTSNVCINLNSYKSKVDFFYLKVEGVMFPEIGRTHQGVIFKVQGNLLPRAVESGKMYVLNEDKELIVTGTFKYIS